MRFTPPSREARQLALLWGVAAVAVAALRPLWLALAPLLPPCPLRALTGVPCPTCGSTRATLALLHADLTAALHANPLVALAGLAFLVGGLGATLWAGVRGPLPVLPHRLPRGARVAALALLAANWMWVVAHS